jgi:carbamoyl-phosphate synthase small subunit
MGEGHCSRRAPSTGSGDASSTARKGTGALVLEDGSMFCGRGIGQIGIAVGEICFNTAMSGYQEILTDPSYAGQIITFTFPHIGNVGVNSEDVEAAAPAARGCIVRSAITSPSSWRALHGLGHWLEQHNLVGLAETDTRRLTRHIRDAGALRGALIHAPGERIDAEVLRFMATSWPGLAGMDLAMEVMCRQAYSWDETCWQGGKGYGYQGNPVFHVVAVDFGAKRNILRCLAAIGCRVTVVPGTTQAREILEREPDGVFLSNGPGDPAATGAYAVPMIQALLSSGLPLFGICLVHQMMALALGAKTYKLHMGHRGANHPVKDLETGRVEITSQNHGFAVDRSTLPSHVAETHVSLFDGTNEGLRLVGAPVFSVQYHPEASPGPHDSHYLFGRFFEMMRQRSTASAA